MTSIRELVSHSVEELSSLRAVLRSEFLVPEEATISLRALLEEADPYDSAIIFVHGVMTGPGWTGGDMEENLLNLYPDEFKNTLFVRLFWGDEPFGNWSSGIGTRMDQVYGMSSRAWSGTAKLADAIGRVQSILGADCPITVLAHSQGCAVTLAALQEGLTLGNLVLMGSPLDYRIVRDRRKNTRVLDAVSRLSGSLLNCSSAEDGTTKLGAVSSALGLSGAQGDPIGRVGLPSSIRRHPDVRSLHLEMVDHYGDDGWWKAKWLSPRNDTWQGDTTPTDLIRLLSSRDLQPTIRHVLPRAALLLEAHKEHVRNSHRRSWFGDHWNEDRDHHGFSATVYVPARTTLCWHYDDMDDARYRITVTRGTLRARLREAEEYRWERQIESPDVTAGSPEVVGILKTTGVSDATYKLEVSNDGDSVAIATIQFDAWDR